MWDTLDDVDALVVPDDLAATLAARAPAQENFAAFPTSVRRNILRWIAHARHPQTRTKRITLTATDAQRNVRVKSNGQAATGVDARLLP